MTVVRRVCAGGARVLVCVIAFAAGGCGLGASGGTPEFAPSVETERNVVSPGAGLTGLRCGQQVRATADGGLSLVGRFPGTAAAGELTAAGRVDVTSSAAVHGIAAPHADMFLVKAGRVVTLPVPQDAVGVRWELAAGVPKSVSGEVTLVSCEPAGGRLAPGAYELYARIAVFPDSGPVVEFIGPVGALDVQ